MSHCLEGKSFYICTPNTESEAGKRVKQVEEMESEGYVFGGVKELKKTF